MELVPLLAAVVEVAECGLREDLEWARGGVGLVGEGHGEPAVVDRGLVESRAAQRRGGRVVGGEPVGVRVGVHHGQSAPVEPPRVR